MNGGTVRFDDGSEVRIHFDRVEGDGANVSFSPDGIAHQFIVGDEISLDFNHVRFRVSSVHDDHCLAAVEHGGEVGSNKAADVQRDLEFDPLSSKDREAIAIGRELGIRNYALSFANRRADVEAMRSACGDEANIICKNESPSGISNLEDIVDAADEILIDRGDLSRKVPVEKVPFLQRRIIATAKSLRTPVYVATNLLESMVTRPSPTRAEVNDVVSTLIMGADGLVLAAETAIGDYPVEAVQMIRSLMNEIERWTPNSSIADIMRS